jgi:hypothetical protein
MSEEMRRRTETWKLSLGRPEQRLSRGSGVKLATCGMALVHPCQSKHLVWALHIARRFGARRARREFAKAQLTDLAMREAVRRENKIIASGVLYDQRRWIRNEFTNNVHQQLFVARPLVSRLSSSELTQELRAKRSGTALSPSHLQHGLLSPIFVKQLSKASAIVRRTEQVKSMEQLLILAGTRLSRRTGAGSVPLEEATESPRFELPVAKLARRHRRLEIARKRMAKESAPQSSIEGGQRATLEMEQPSNARRTRKHLPALQEEAFEMASAPLRGMNVTQVADEVMKQLDKRLIAARERMGKI